MATPPNPVAAPVPELSFRQGSSSEPARTAWANTPMTDRLRTLRRMRHLLAERHAALTDTIPGDLARTRADSLAAEVLPLLAACQFLEREAERILARRRLGRSGRPFWLAGIHASVERAPLGTILIIAPANYPLFLPGVQALQALAAGNAVVWKPGRNGQAVAQLFAAIAADAGLPAGLLRVTEESIEAGIAEIQVRPDKIVFTGSASAGREVQRLAAELSIPAVAELSGCDGVFILPGADTKRVLDALCFGMRLNGSATCMAPRRLILIGGGHNSLLAQLQQRFAAMEPVFVREPVLQQVKSLLTQAREHGAAIFGEVGDVSMKPVLVLHGAPEMAIAQADVFAPVLTAIEVDNVSAALHAESQCPYGLTAAVFGDEPEARKLAACLHVGTVLINDLIVPTADPRVPFGGRKASGFGATRGAEGLLEMTAAKTVSVRRGTDRKHFQPTGESHAELFAGVIDLTHRIGWRARLAGLRHIVEAARKLK